MNAYLCCMNCFNDIHLKKFIQSNGELANKCDFCSSEKNICINPPLLLEKFEFLIGYFEEDNDGESLSTLLNNIYSIFHEDINKKTELLLEKILGETYQKKKYKPKFDTSSYINQWNQFKDEIKFENRFFPVNSIYSSIFNIEQKESIFFELLSQLTKKIPKEQIFYRARVSENELKEKDMGAPPKGTSSAGRANPIGISYLYLASNLETCISEVRPNNASSIYVSEFKGSGSITILDLTNPKKDTSIMAFEAEKLNLVSSCLELLEILSSELSKPILPNKSIIDYIPTQFLCEFIKSVGKFNGIAFNSSFNHGTNYVFYDPNNFIISSPKKYKINEISYDFDVIDA